MKKRREEPVLEEERSDDKHPGCLIRGISFFSCTLLVLIVLFGGLYLALSGDLFGITTRLREIAMTDSGDGSHGDTSNSRIAVKYYMLQVLTAISGETTENKPSIPVSEFKEEKPEPVTKPEQKEESQPMPAPPELPDK